MNLLSSFFRELLLAIQETSPALAVLATLVFVVMIGTGAQILAERLRIPATAPLLLAGLIFGPAFIGLVQPDVLGVFLRVVVRAAVCIVIFEGGLLLDLGAVRQTSRAVIGLATAGLLITMTAAAALAHYLANWSWELSFLFGAIVSVTGPTVITPILQRVRVNERVRATLESESVIADPLGVILASLVFTAITSPRGWRHALPYASSTLITGIAVGAGAGMFIWLVSRKLDLLPAKYTRLMILGVALMAYTGAEVIAHESGVLASALAGIVVGSLNIRHKEQIREFKGDIASIAISLVFVLLAASLRPREIADLGWREALIVVLLIVVVRPLCVFVSTFRSELRPNEKGFVASLGPRGIVAASVATFFSIELIDTGYPINGRELVTLVFAVILGTVLLQGTAASWLAKVFKVMPRQNIIIGADSTTLILARKLAAEGETLTVVDTNRDAFAEFEEIDGVRTICDDATDVLVLRRAGATDAKALVAATTSDKLNLLVCQVARASFSIPRIVARANQPSNTPAFEAAQIEVISAEDATAIYLENTILRPSLTSILRRTAPEQKLAEVKVTSRPMAGRSLSDIALQGCVVVALRRGDEIVVPTGRTRLKHGDILTVLGNETAVEAAHLRFTAGQLQGSEA